VKGKFSNQSVKRSGAQLPINIRNQPLVCSLSTTGLVQKEETFILSESILLTDPLIRFNPIFVISLLGE
jgi:hypothetical protein